MVSKQAGNMLMGINLTSERPDLDGVFLSNYASNNLVEALGRVPGVGSAEVMGAKDYSMRVWLDPRRMASLDVTVAEVAAALREQNQIVAAGKLGQPGRSAANCCGESDRFAFPLYRLDETPSPAAEPDDPEIEQNDPQKICSAPA